ncbi:hypothetical protein PHYBOEH_008866 [Phytophthora boehmeriae]|uniref:Uncharacterized protein n=1 Tax=Phytophthora boehmeriae TaxID=109152 RepID=A0A8T1VXK2_9STRA|nr:hypothetical protein PHYBOEH_008866 [Phytophthora boehmeriae]
MKGDKTEAEETMEQIPSPPQQTQTAAQTMETYDQQLQQYQQQMAAIATTTMQQQQLQQQDERLRELETKSDRMLAMLDQQCKMIEAQNRQSEENSEALKKLLEQLTNKDSAVL